MTEDQSRKSERHKHYAALTSVVAAILLTGFKIIVGIMTGSLGILAEAAHSSFDFLAALMTYFAVRISGIPADKNHTYGHGKVENLSALFETLLLLITCVLIVKEAIERLFFREMVVDASMWAFVVMIVSIVIDYSRSRVLFRAAKLYNSQALEADALHFSTDIWSATVVIVGLICVKISEYYPQFAFLTKADAIAALGVAVIVIVVSIKMAKSAIQVLIDTAPAGMDSLIKREVENLQGVTNCHDIRIRSAGSKIFIDVHVVMDGNMTLAEAHALTEVIEGVIRKIKPEADIIVHPEPYDKE